MQVKRPSKISEMSFRSRRILLPIALPVLLLLAFLGKQFISLDAIGWSHGFNHPLEGWDHLITMLAVGIWAAQMRGQAIWMLPLAFVSVMSLGGLAGAAGLSIPSVEGIILLSGAVFSVLITRKIRFSTKINVLIVAFFAFFHGFAHGQEISTSASLISYTLGFMFATLLLHGAGILVAKLVVLSVACLLTMLFANAGHANTPGTATHSKTKIIALTQGNAFEPGQILWFNTQNTGQSGGYLEESIPPNLSANFAITSANTPHQTADLSPPAKNYATDMQPDSALHGILLKNAQFQIMQAIQSQALCYEVNASLNRLEFNHYYPNINNSPGTSLLSGGVGLTSPPVLFTPFSFSFALPDSYKSPASFIEEPVLQSVFTKFQLDNPKTLILKSRRHSFALQNWRSDEQRPAKATHCHNTSAPYSASLSGAFDHLNYPAIGPMSFAQLSAPHQKSMRQQPRDEFIPFTEWQRHSFIFKHKNNNLQIPLNI